VKICQIETGVIKPAHITLRNAQKLAAALGCEPKDLLESEG
jgi:DNA-binding Xre family transcriptional regulator